MKLKHTPGFAGMTLSLLAAVTGMGLVSSCTKYTSAASEEKIQEAIGEELTDVNQAWSVPAEVAGEDIDWLGSFDDPLLVKLVEEALLKNNNLRATAASLGQAQALVDQASAALKPTLALTTGTTRSGGVSASAPAQSSTSVGLQASWELDIWGRALAGKRAAQASAAAAMAEFRYARHSLAASTIKAYLASVEAKLQEGVAQERLDALVEIRRIVNVRFDNGLVSAQDVSLAEADLAGAREQIAVVKGAWRDAVRALELLLGRYPDASLDIGAVLPAVPPLPPLGVPSQILERRPDIIAAERRVAAAFNYTAQAKAARLPSLSLTASTGGASGNLSQALNPANTSWQLAANLAGPIFDGGAGKARVAAASADQKQALAAYAQAALTAFGEVERTLDQGVVLNERLHQLKIVVEQSDRAYEIAKIRYEEGESDLLDLLRVQQQLIGARSNLESARRQQLEQRVQLHLALGGAY